MPGAAKSATPGIILSESAAESLRTRGGCKLVRLRCRRIDDRRHLEHSIRWKSSESGVLTNDVGVGGDVDTGDLVLGYVALNPLDAGTELLQYVAGPLRDTLPVCGGNCRRIRALPFDQVLRHWRAPVRRGISLVDHAGNRGGVRARHVRVPAGEHAARVFLPHPGVKSPELKSVVLEELLAEQLRRRRRAAVERIGDDVLHSYQTQPAVLLGLVQQQLRFIH